MDKSKVVHRSIGAAASGGRFFREEDLHELPDDVSLVGAAAMAATGPIALTQLQTVGVPPGGTVLVTGMTGALATAIAALAPRFDVRVLGLARRVALVPPSLGVETLEAGRDDLAFPRAVAE